MRTFSIQQKIKKNRKINIKDVNSLSSRLVYELVKLKLRYLISKWNFINYFVVLIINSVINTKLNKTLLSPFKKEKINTIE